MSEREQSWSDRPSGLGRLVLVSDNPVSHAMTSIAEAVGLDVVTLADDEGRAAVKGLRDLAPGERDSVVICDHDAPDATQLLRDALDGPPGYVAMLASRSRTARVLDELRAEGYGEDTLVRLHMPAGLDTGGKTPGEMALSVVAEVVACAHDRSGGPMRATRGETRS
ncbi:MAG TPA: XdhC family protein [Nocardioidaceae bacterium]|nr:XdhC family protein [Nocardioidaceae bacterium]